MPSDSKQTAGLNFLQSYINQTLNSLKGIIRFSILLTIITASIYLTYKEGRYVWLSASDDLFVFFQNLKGGNLSYNFPYRELLELLYILFPTYLALVFLVAYFVGKSALSSDYRRDYRVISAKEFNLDLERWHQLLDKKLAQIKKESRSWLYWNELGGASGDHRLNLLWGLFVRIGKEGVVVPERALSTHSGMVGSTQTGKSSLIQEILPQLRDQGASCIILDYNGEYYSRFSKEFDAILCPFHKNAERHDLFSEPVLPEFIAHALIESSGSENKFFSDNARNLFSDLLRISTSHKELNSLLMMDFSSLKELLSSRNFQSSSLLQDQRTAGNILSSMQTNLMLLSHLDSLNPLGRPFSIVDWAKRGSRSWVFVVVPESHLAVLKPWIRLYIDLAITGCLERGIRSESIPPTFLIGDEFSRLGNLPSLPLALTNGAKYRLSCILGWQSDSQIKEIYGEKAIEILNNIRTRFIFNPGNNEETLKSAAHVLGKEDITDVYINRSMARRDSGSIAANLVEKERYVVNPNELSRLQELEFYLKCTFQRPVRLSGRVIQKKQARPVMEDILVPQSLRSSGEKSD